MQHKVAEREHLYKDDKSMGVVNTDVDGLKRAKAAKQRILDEQAKTMQLEDRVAKLEQMLEQVLNNKDK